MNQRKLRSKLLSHRSAFGEPLNIKSFAFSRARFRAMGVVVTEVVFDGRAPALSRIADKVTALSGLPLSVTASDVDELRDMYDLNAHLAFACAPKTQLEMKAYRAGAVKEFCDQTFKDVPFPMSKVVQGANEPLGTQTVYLRGYIGQEPTLMAVTTLALEALGGRPKHPLTDEERREYDSPITPEELVERQRKLTRQLWPMAAVSLLLLPMLIPFWLVGFVVMLPWRIWKGYRMIRAIENERTDTAAREIDELEGRTDG